MGYWLLAGIGRNWLSSLRLCQGSGFDTHRERQFEDAMLFFKRSYGPKIQLLAQKDVSDGYNGYTKKYRKVSDVRQYINEYVFAPIEKTFLSISCSLHGYIIPMMDIDDEKDLVIATMWLEENGIRYNIIKSGLDSYWLFLDCITKNNARVIKMVYLAPGVDPDYRGFLRRGKVVAVRGFYRDPYYDPELTSVGTDNEIVCDFCNQVIEHYKSDMLKWLYRYEAYMDGKIDIADPRTGVVGKMMLKDILDG